jgi:hypothetical protein
MSEVPPEVRKVIRGIHAAALAQAKRGMEDVTLCQGDVLNWSVSYQGYHNSGASWKSDEVEIKFAAWQWIRENGFPTDEVATGVCAECEDTFDYLCPSCRLTSED